MSEHGLLAEKRFVAEVVKETSYGQVGTYGKIANRMRLYRTPKATFIEWVVGDEKDPDEEVEIGLWFNGNAVVEYDGVFSMPIEALDLLRECGFNTKEVEVSK